MKYIVKYKRLSEDAVPPRKAHASDAGWDLTVSRKRFDRLECDYDYYYKDKSNDLLEYGCGLAFDFSSVGYALAFPRSSTYKTGLILSNCVGVIDGGYRGEVTAKFYVHRTGPDSYGVGDRFLQLVFPALKVGDEVEFVEVDELDDSDRGTGGYGSSGR